MKETDPEMVLQLRNLPCHRRLTELALTGHGRKGTRLHHTHQDTERAQKIHRFPRKTQRSCKAKRDYPGLTRGVSQQDGRPGMRVDQVTLHWRRSPKRKPRCPMSKLPAMLASLKAILIAASVA